MASDDAETCEGGKRRGGTREALELCDGLFNQVISALTRHFESVHGHVGHFAPRGVAARRLAQLLRRGRRVQDVVRNLKRESHVFAVAGKGVELAGRRAGDHGADADGRAEQRTRLVGVDEVHEVGGGLPAFGGEILTQPMLIAAAVIVVSVMLITLSKRK